MRSCSSSAWAIPVRRSSWNEATFEMLGEPTMLQRRAFELLGVYRL